MIIPSRPYISLRLLLSSGDELSSIAILEALWVDLLYIDKTEVLRMQQYSLEETRCNTP